MKTRDHPPRTRTHQLDVYTHCQKIPSRATGPRRSYSSSPSGPPPTFRLDELNSSDDVYSVHDNDRPSAIPLPVSCEHTVYRRQVSTLPHRARTVSTTQNKGIVTNRNQYCCTRSTASASFACSDEETYNLHKHKQAAGATKKIPRLQNNRCLSITYTTCS